MREEKEEEEERRQQKNYWTHRAHSKSLTHAYAEREKARVLELKTINLTLEKFPHSHKEQIVWIPFFSIIIIIIIVVVVEQAALPSSSLQCYYVQSSYNRNKNFEIIKFTFYSRRRKNENAISPSVKHIHLVGGGGVRQNRQEIILDFRMRHRALSYSRRECSTNLVRQPVPARAIARTIDERETYGMNRDKLALEPT